MTTNGQQAVADAAEPSAASRRRRTRVRLLAAALALGGVAVLVVAALWGSGDGGDSAGVTGSAVWDRFPDPGDEALQQQRVGVRLDPRYRLSALVVYPNDRYVGGVDVTSEVNHTEGLNEFEFRPDEGRSIELLSADANCVRATYVLIARPSESATVDWCFEVS